MKAKLTIILIFTLIISILPLHSSHIPIFKDGDRVCFIGDSITHGGMYPSYIYLYYLTRFPNNKMTFFNAGISGDTAIATIKRFDKDIADSKPTVSTLMLGMNDIGRWLYGKNSDNESKKEAMVNSYKKNMNTLIDKVKKLNSKIIYITPSIYDQTSKMKSKNLLGVNDGLAILGEYIKDRAKKENCGYVDFNKKMLTINNKYQEKNSSSTIIGSDRIHPGPMGHFIMAYIFLKSQNVPKYISNISIDAKLKKVTINDNCEIKNLNNENGVLSFDALEKSLPYPTNNNSSITNALKVIPFTETMNQEIIKITNLPKSNYELKIDNISLGTFSNIQFNNGVNIATIDQTPQYKQANEIKKLIKQRRTIISKQRTLAMVDYNTLSDFKGDRNDAVAIKTHLDKQFELIKDKPWAPYIEKKNKGYLKNFKNKKQYKYKLKNIQKKLYETNKPKWHKYKIICLP